MFFSYRRKPKVVATVILSVAVLLFLVSAISYIYQRHFLSTCQTADGQVVQIIEHQLSDGSYYHAVFSFRDATGQKYTITSTTSSSTPPAPVGIHCPVYYPPAHPDQAVIYISWLSYWCLPLLTLGLALIYLPLGLALWHWPTINIRFKRKPK